MMKTMSRYELPTTDSVSSIPLLAKFISENGVEIVDIEIKTYFGMKAIAYTTTGSLKHYRAFPWRLMVFDGKKLHRFYGIPNYVETKAKALKRGWYRAKWLSEGTYENRYR